MQRSFKLFLMVLIACVKKPSFVLSQSPLTVKLVVVLPSLSSHSNVNYHQVSSIYSLLQPLKFLDLHVGDDDITCDKDYKHIFKRFRNLFIRERGVVIMGR
jgi:hypothetical protein